MSTVRERADAFWTALQGKGREAWSMLSELEAFANSERRLERERCAGVAKRRLAQIESHPHAEASYWQGAANEARDIASEIGSLPDEENTAPPHDARNEDGAPPDDPEAAPPTDTNPRALALRSEVQALETRLARIERYIDDLAPKPEFVLGLHCTRCGRSPARDVVAGEKCMRPVLVNDRHCCCDGVYVHGAKDVPPADSGKTGGAVAGLIRWLRSVQESEPNTRGYVVDAWATAVEALQAENAHLNSVHESNIAIQRRMAKELAALRAPPAPEPLPEWFMAQLRAAANQYQPKELSLEIHAVPAEWRALLARVEAR